MSAVVRVLMKHREQKLGAVTTGCSCSWTPAARTPAETVAGPSLLRQFVMHVEDELALLVPSFDEHADQAIALVSA